MVIKLPEQLDDAIKQVSDDLEERMGQLLRAPEAYASTVISMTPQTAANAGSSVARGEEAVLEAMRYSALSGGKRLRPFLTICSAGLFGVSNDSAIEAACAIEFIHTYSLIHDDLPCMDDDDFRRGKPSTHRRFGDAVAVLTGDALLSDAFGFIAGAPINASKQCLVLSTAIGSQGMVLGQLDDLVSAQKTCETLQNKTGKLFECAYRLGAIAVGATRFQELRLAKEGAAFGLEFQLLDDIADGERCDF